MPRHSHLVAWQRLTSAVFGDALVTAHRQHIRHRRTLESTDRNVNFAAVLPIVETVAGKLACRPSTKPVLKCSALSDLQVRLHTCNQAIYGATCRPGNARKLPDMQTRVMCVEVDILLSQIGHGTNQSSGCTCGMTQLSSNVARSRRTAAIDRNQIA